MLQRKGFLKLFKFAKFLPVQVPWGLAPILIFTFSICSGRLCIPSSDCIVSGSIKYKWQVIKLQTGWWQTKWLDTILLFFACFNIYHPNSFNFFFDAKKFFFMKKLVLVQQSLDVDSEKLRFKEKLQFQSLSLFLSLSLTLKHF